jgi:hypothetical protein
MGIGIAIPKKKLFECEWELELELKNFKKIAIPIHNKHVLNQFISLTKIYLTNIFIKH